MKGELVFLLFSITISSMTMAKSVIELDAGNWEKETKAKSLFIIFCTPWCMHCKEIEATWEKLGEVWNRNQDTLIGRVDCDTEGSKAICEQLKIVGTPTLLYGGDPNNLLEYAGDKDYEALNEWAKDVLIPYCGPYNLKACSEADSERIKKWMGMREIEIEKMIEDVLDTEKSVSGRFEEEISKLQIEYDTLNDYLALKKAGILSNIKLLKSVRLHRKGN